MNRLITYIFFLAISYNSLLAQEIVAPELEFTCELKVTIDSALRLGTTAHGERVIIPITGGTFEGPRMKGVVLSGGADYQYVNTELGRTELDAIYTIRTNDNVLIHIRNVGILYNPNEDKRSDAIDSDEIYFRTAPIFEAPVNTKYDWLNNAVFICKPVSQKEYISIQVWKVI